jgi:hypothetical protein
MLIEAFVKLVNARGVDFMHVAGAASRTDGVARKRKLTRAEIKIRRELKLSLKIEPSAKGSGTRVSREPSWQIDLARALRGVRRMPELAVYFSLAGWLGEFEELHRGLMHSQLKEMNRDRTWPMVVEYSSGRLGEPYDYVPRLATLVLIADAFKQSFLDAEGLHGNWTPYSLIGMDEALWERQLNGRYVFLRHEYESWYKEGIRMIQRAYGVEAHADDEEEIEIMEEELVA